MLCPQPDIEHVPLSLHWTHGDHSRPRLHVKPASHTVTLRRSMLASHLPSSRCMVTVAPSHLVRLSDRGIGDGAIVFCVITPLLGHHRAASHSQSDSSHSQKRLSHLPPPSLHHCIGDRAITPLYNPPCFSAIHPPLNITNELQWVSRGDTKWQFLHEIHFHWMPCNFNSRN